MKKTLKKLSAFLKRVFKCGCNKPKTRKMKGGKGKIMKGGWPPKKSNSGLQTHGQSPLLSVSQKSKINSALSSQIMPKFPNPVLTI